MSKIAIAMNGSEQNVSLSQIQINQLARGMSTFVDGVCSEPHRNPWLFISKEQSDELRTYHKNERA